ncbi:MAG: peptidylprolyl isomerase, partial [Candidatus Enteromonas sp.]|nr:peptidylprolyl isomerase [Candidatus Enteromonas sp.]
RGRKLDYTIKGEFKANGVNNNLIHKRGVISMARTMIPDSATSQFFIVHKDAPHLDGQYAAFGTMIEGEDVLDAIAKVRTDRFNDKPYEDVVIESVEVIDEPENDYPVIK